MIAFLFLTAVLAAAQPSAPHWGGLPADTAAGLEAEGIVAQKYERLAGGEVLTERRPIPSGKTGVHMAAFGIVRSPVEKVWNAIVDCEKTPSFMPHLDSCELVRPDHPLAPNQKWEQLDMSFRILFFNKSARLVNEATMEAPNYLKWNQVRGDAKVNEGYYRIITIAPDTQFVVYDALVDPGVSVPSFVMNWIIGRSLPEVITALRDRTESPQSRYAS
jgi:uncharacterized membrane protein